MGWRSKLESGSPQRDPTPLYVATAGLLLSIGSYAISNEGVSGTLFGSGLITAGFCIVYWFANPGQGDD
ncbi:hypothetical protein ACNHKD_00750 [Methylocystis sp. JAN1]|uniref:hypothetical protein n=1 Tax=Methylocystis sp. JAN1 TaxID=3397211 RepID=UPI003FA2A74E